MKTNNEIFNGYENTLYYSYNELSEDFPNTVYYDELPEHDIVGVLKANRYVNGRLLQTYSEKENHLLGIAGTRLGKTTSLVIPQIFSFAKARNKKSMIISDPKGEIYRHVAAMLRREGYKVLLLNFRDYRHSECWNPLTPIYRKFKTLNDLYDEVEIVDTPQGPKHKFKGKIYDTQKDLDEAIFRWRNMLLTEVGNDIDSIAVLVSPTLNDRDPYWEDNARELLKAYLWAMLEDSVPDPNGKRETITEDTFSFSTVISLMGVLNPNNDGEYDDGYFSERPSESRARQIAQTCIPANAASTRQCITTMFATKMSIFRESAIRLVTSCNSFDMDMLADEDTPIALFIDFRDEIKLHYGIISMFIQDAYRLLIEHANNKKEGKRDKPFYFVLDEFGNFPPMKNFENIISACAGRNIFFIIILQSYAQLNAVYGPYVAEVIKDNLNQHVFFGSNNPETLEAFSQECGMVTRISPLSALNGSGAEIDHYQIETIRLIPKSRLTRLEPGECIITEANSGYVLFSKLERYYLCKEYNEEPLEDEKEYQGAVDPFDKRYSYKMPVKQKKRQGYFD